MKKFFYILMTLCLCILLTACLRSDNADKDTADGGTNAEPAATDTADTTGSQEPETDAPATDAPVTDAPDSDTTAPDTAVPETEAPETEAPPAVEYPPVTDAPVTVTYPVDAPAATFSGLPSLPNVEYTVYDPYNSRGLSALRNPFSFGVASDGTPHHITVNNQATFDSYGTNALAWDNKSGSRVLYLTFDCGYKFEELTSDILDTLKEKDVPAAFFCTLDYLDDEPEVITRMINEGHIVGNHSTTHPDCTTISRERFAWELLGVHNYMRANFGYTPEYFRFPTGAFSEDAVELADSVGYKSVFWSVAYADWDPYNQQGTESAYSQVTSRLHPGAVILLHSTSPDNAAILGRVIDYARAQGYTFKSLDEYGYWK